MAGGFVTHLPEERRYELGPAAFELGSTYLEELLLDWALGMSGSVG